MAAWTLIAVAVGMCWLGILTLGWLLCRAAKQGDETSAQTRVVPLRSERMPSAAQRQ